MKNCVYIVVPVYNVENYLRRCVDSLLAQTYENCKIVLIDDGSPDNSGAICDEYALAHPEIALIHQENGGLSAARNTGIEYALSHSQEGDWLTFVDSDDFLAPDCVERLVQIAAEHPVSLVQCAYEKGDKDLFSPREGAPKVIAASSRDTLLGYAYKSQMCAKLFRLSLFAELRFRKGVWNEDEFITYRLAWLAEQIAITDEPLYYYYQRNESIMDTLAKRMKNHPHRMDWMEAYNERMAFFQNLGEEDQVLRTREKICTDIIIRYTEQASLPADKRDDFFATGAFRKLYREHYSLMRKRSGIPVKRRAMFAVFALFPGSSVVAGKFMTLRK